MRVVNLTTASVTLTLKDGTSSDVVIEGGSFATQINLIGTTSAGSILGGGGTDTVTLTSNASATAINLGNGNNQVTLSQDAVAGTVVGGDGTDSVTLSGNASATSINVGNGGFGGWNPVQTVTLSDNARVGSIVCGNGVDQVTLSGNARATVIDLGDNVSNSSQIVLLQDAASATTILGGGGVDRVLLFGSGSAHVTTITLGSNSDTVSIANASAWNPGITIDGGSSSDRLELGGSGIYDLRTATLTGIEYLGLGNGTVALVDDGTLDGFSNLSGGAASRIETAEASLDLTGISLTGATAHSSNTVGTTFTADNKATALQVFGGSGTDTLQATSLTFTALEREAIFALTSIETIVDASGYYGNDLANTIIGDAGANIIEGGDGNDRLAGGGGSDSLSGGADADTFVFTSESDGTDTIKDFVTGLDVIEIAAAGFGGGLWAGMDVATVFDVSSDGNFGSSAIRFHFDTLTDTLYFDADGSAAGSAAVALATFSNNLALDSGDFVVV